ncbi:MAG TPA: UvrD-helicase domain-containing protein [Acidimicrobiales bacterium]
MSTVTAVPSFDVCGPLPAGVTVLEASAGTGKTFTIAALTARYVASGIPLEELLLVTFTRMATGELRDRVRQRLVTAEDGLARARAGIRPPPDDAVLGVLADAPDRELERRRRFVAKALADFDAATIATTHGFCQHVLSGLGVAGDVEREVTFVEDLSDLVIDVVDDLYMRKFLRRGDPPFSLAEAQRIGRIAVDNPFAPIEPSQGDPNQVWAMRQRLAVAVRNEVEARKRQAGVMTYDDLLTRLRHTLSDETRGPAACDRLRSYYRVALVDEFQDTDPVQWDIMRMAFGQGGATLVLIGDPKQAIYSFRGADVYAYLAAARQAATQATLGINWRSDQDLINAYDAIFAGAKLGHEGIAYRHVRAADANQRRRLIDAPVDAALRLRVVPRADGLVQLTKYGFAVTASAREHIADDLAADLVRLLSSAAYIEIRRPDGSTARRQAVRPGHIAVLVRTHRQAALVRDALDRVAIPAVINGAGSVFATGIAREWLRLLEALERPTSTTRARSAALTVFLGWSAQQVASSEERAWEDLSVRLHRWAGVLRQRGVASLLETVTRTERLPERILAHPDGERAMTDLRHVGQLLHAEATSKQWGATALTGWLRQRIAEADADTDDEDRSRRLESDAEAVQVLTIHRSKGLEYPIVYYPYLWEPSHIPKDPLPIFHDPDAGDQRTINVGRAGPGFGHQLTQYIAEERGEDLRLAYVALTRAQHQAIVWWAGSQDSRDSSLSRLLFSRDLDGNVAPTATRQPKDSDVLARCEELREAAPGCISVERSVGGNGSVWAGRPGRAVELRAGVFLRELDPRWRRTSYSAITSGDHEPKVASEPELTVISDEAPPTAGRAPVSDVVIGPEDAGLRSTPSLLADTPGGVDVGTFIHSVLERTDFTSVDLGAELTSRIAEEQSRRQVDIGEPDELVRGLAAAIETPLGPLVGDLRLRDLDRRDRLDELAFEVPLIGGDAPSGELTVGAIGALLRAHLPADDVLAGYAGRLDDLSAQSSLRGYLSGSIDLVLRTEQPGGPARFAVVDYKTNWLGSDGQALSAWNYRPATLAEEMQRAHYPLQSLLYIAALHRYLRWRLPGYDPGRNLAGVLYLFVRGMSGAATPRVDGQPCGVFAWSPPLGLVAALSDLLDSGPTP